MTPSTVQTHGNIKHESGFSPYNEVEGIVRGLFLFYMGYNTHSFSVELATTLGLEKTLILQHFYYWHLSNKDNEGMFKDNHTWFFTSRKNILNTFPYLTERKIRDAIDKLIKDGYVLKGNYNPDKMKKTNWYALTKKSLKLFDQSSVNMSNDWSKCPTKDNINKDNNIEKESISKDIPKKEENLSPKSLQTPLGEKEKSSAKKKEKTLPFEDDELRKMWEELVKYPDWQRKTDHAIDLRLKTLERLAKGDVNYARAIMRQTLDKGWQDFYDVKGYKPEQQPAPQPRKKTKWEEMGVTEEQYREMMKK